MLRPATNPATAAPPEPAPGPARADTDTSAIAAAPRRAPALAVVALTLLVGVIVWLGVWPAPLLDAARAAAAALGGF
jgi:ferric-dicitrate binding protein FerR (iron transport regulator)